MSVNRCFLPSLIVFLVFILTIPIVYGYINQPVEKKFLGITGLNPYEQFYYLSVGPSQAIKGDLLFSERYGRIQDKKVLFNPIANIIGLLVFVTGSPLTIAFAIFRIFSSVILVFAFYKLARTFISSYTTLCLSVLLYVFSGGFSFIQQISHSDIIRSSDNSVAEANMFISMSSEYYLPLANALFILVLYFAYGLFFKQKEYTWQTGASLLALGAVYVYGLVTAVFIISVTALFRGYTTKQLSLAVFKLFKLSLFCVPIAAYYAWLISLFPSIADDGWFAPMDIFTLLCTFGFGFLFSLLGIFFKHREQNLEQSYLWAWLILTLVAIYTPQQLMPIQLEMLIGIGAPLAILSATSLQAMYKFIADKNYALHSNITWPVKYGLISVVVALCSLTNVKFYLQEFDDLNNQTMPWYASTEIYNAVHWCAKNLPVNGKVIISQQNKFFFSTYTDHTLYCGVGPFEVKTPEEIQTEQALELIARDEISEARMLFRKIEVRYVFLDKSLSPEKFNEIRERLEQHFKVCYSNKMVSVIDVGRFVK